MKRIIMLTVFLAVTLFLVPSCSGVSQQEYDRVSSELNSLKGQMASLQGKLTEAESLQGQNDELNRQYTTAKVELEAIKAQNEDLNTRFEELKVQLDDIASEFEDTQARYEDVNAQYENLNGQFQELTQKYNVLLKGTAQISEQDIEQAVFNLVNQERGDYGLAEVQWGDNLYKWALANSRAMAAEKRLKNSEYAGWQGVFWATGYGTADGIARAAVTVWQNQMQYEGKFLATGARYGAAGVYKSGDIYYITYLADYFR